MDQMERSGERLHTLSIRSDNVVMLLERAVSRRQAATCSVAVPARSKTKPSEAGTSQRVSTRRPLDSSADADMHGGDAEETEQKRQRLTTAAQPASPASEPAATDVWYELVECGDAGHCFYNVIATGYAISKGEDMAVFQKALPGRGKGLRKTIAETVAKNPDAYRHWWEPPKTLVGTEAEKQTQHAERLKQEDGEPAGTYEDYVRCLWRPNRWADEIAWRVAAERLQTIIVACHGAPNKATHFTAIGDPQASRTIYICYDAGHFTLIRPKVGHSFPGEWKKLGKDKLEMEVSVPRGGGTEDARSATTCKSWLQPEDTKSVHTSTSWLPEDTQCQHFQDGHPEASSSCVAPVSHAQAQGTPDIDRDGSYDARTVASWMPEEVGVESSLSRQRRHKLIGKQPVPGARPSAEPAGGSSAALELGDLPDVPLDCALAALRIETASQRLPIQKALDEIVRLGGTVESYPWLNKSMTKTSHHRSVRFALRLLKEVTELQRNTGHDFAWIPRKVCVKEQRVRGAWGCRQCCEIHAHLFYSTFCGGPMVILNRAGGMRTDLNACAAMVLGRLGTSRSTGH